MSAQIIYGVVFGKPKEIEATVAKPDAQPAIDWTRAFEWPSVPFCDDVFYMSPPIVDRPCDSEAE